MRSIVRKELRDALRNHWLQGYSAGLAILGLMTAQAAAQGSAGLAMQTFGRTTASLTNLCLLLAPLVALGLGAATIAGERDRGTLERLLAQPLERWAVVAGKYVGLLVSLIAATLIGFLPAGFVVVANGGAGQLLVYSLFPALAILVIAAMLGVGVLVSVRSRTGAQAQARSIFLWFLFVMLYDLILMGTLMTASLRPAVLALLLLVNPVSAGRVLAVLALEADLYLLGPAGAWLVEELTAAGAAATLLASLLVWTLGSFALALWAFRLRPDRTPWRARFSSAGAAKGPTRRASRAGSDDGMSRSALQRARTT